MGAVFDREFRSYFMNIIGYLFIGLLLMTAGIYTASLNLFSRYPNFELVLSRISIYYVVLIPILTMRSVTDDRRLKTDQLLYSLPLRPSQVVLGKYFAMTSILLVSCIIIAFYPVVLSRFGTVSYPTAFCTLIGFFFLGCAMIAIGMFMSSLTDNQITSFILSVFVFAAFALLPSLSTILPATPQASLAAITVAIMLIGLLAWRFSSNIPASVIIALVLEIPAVIVFLVNRTIFEGLFQKFASKISLFSGMGSFSKGIFDITSLVYYISVAALFVFFTVQSIDKRRWS